MHSINRTARLTGLLYLMLFPSPFGLIYVPSRLIVSRDAAATAQNILGSEWLFRLGIISNLTVAMINLFVVLALYQLLKSVNKSLAMLMVMFIVVSLPIVMVNEVSQFAALLLIGGTAPLAGFTLAQLQALALLFLKIHGQGINIAQIFWGLWLFPMGYLVFKSAFLPKILGVFLIIGCFGYLIDALATLLVPSLGLNVIFFTGIGELLLPLWLLIKGVNIQQWEKRALGTS